MYLKPSLHQVPTRPSAPPVLQLLATCKALLSRTCNKSTFASIFVRKSPQFCKPNLIYLGKYSLLLNIYTLCKYKNVSFYTFITSALQYTNSFQFTNTHPTEQDKHLTEHKSFFHAKNEIQRINPILSNRNEHKSSKSLRTKAVKSNNQLRHRTPCKCKLANNVNVIGQFKHKPNTT